MSLVSFGNLLGTLKDGVTQALRVVSESKITGGYSPANLTMQNAVTANGNGTLLNVNEYATAVLEVRGTFSATINFECSIDDTNWYSIIATKNDGTISSSCTTVGLYEIKVAAWKSIRARVSGYVSGNVTVVGKVSPLVNSEKSVQLTGRNVMKLIPVNALALTDTIARYYTVDISPYNNITVIAVSTLNQVLSITPRYESGTVMEQYSGSSWSELAVTMNSDGIARYRILNTQVPWLDKIKSNTLGIRIQCSSIAPTSGSISIYVLGVPN